METVTAHGIDELPYWENIATTRSYVKYESEIEKKAILKAHNLASIPSTALEIGCEGGRWSKVLADFGWDMICTDVNQQSLLVCKKRIPAAKCILVNPDDRRLPCETESIRLALCIGVPPVLPSDWFIDEAFRVLENGGVLVGTFWNRFSWRGLIHQALAKKRNTSDWFYRLPYPQWRKRLRQRGFSLMYEEGYGWPPVRRTSNSSLVPIATRVERYVGLRKLVSVSPLIAFIAQKNG